MIKRLLDVNLAILIILLFSPLYVFLFIMVFIKMGNPIFFYHNRAGLNRKEFTLLKFRTMTNELDLNGNLYSDRERITKFGKLLRSYSLDELPSIWNVLKGDMSLVGPRPLLMQYLPLYTVNQDRRHEVKPGITGWAQVNGRNSISWEEKFELDVWYADNSSIYLDIKILWLTMKKVLAREGINAQGHATMPVFKGLKK